VPVSGGAERRLASARFSTDAFMQLAWSPDGKTIAYSGDDDAGAQGIRLLDVASQAEHPLARPAGCWKAGMPAWSVDGRRFAFACITGVGLYTVYDGDSDAAHASAIADLRGEPRGLTWELNGSGLIVASDGALWRVTTSGAITKFPFGDDAAAPARAGRYLAYTRARAPVAIWRVDLTAPDPAATAAPLVASAWQDVAPAFSADGQRIAFQSTRSAKSEIWMMEASGANPLALTHLHGPRTGDPAICADGMRVVFDSNVNGVPQLFIVDVDEGRPRQVRSSEPSLRSPQWSVDCFWLLASDGRGRLSKLPAAGGRAEPFTERDSYRAQVVGDRVVFNVIHDSGVTLWMKSMKGGQEKSLDGLPALGIDDAWTVSRSGVYFTSGDGGGAAVHLYGFDDRKVRRVTSLPGAWPAGGMSVSRDDRWLLYTRPAAADGDIMLVDLKP
jgi:Tol biopolymer transport system component